MIKVARFLLTSSVTGLVVVVSVDSVWPDVNSVTAAASDVFFFRLILRELPCNCSWAECMYIYIYIYIYIYWHNLNISPTHTKAQCYILMCSCNKAYAALHTSKSTICQNGLATDGNIVKHSLSWKCLAKLPSCPAAHIVDTAFTHCHQLSG